MCEAGASLHRPMTPSPLVSCLCVTRARVALLRRAVACFQAQTHAPRELVLLYESDDADTAAYAATLSDPSIRCVEVPASPKRPLGALRNLAIEASQGAYIAQWDDDDWYSPARLAAQMDAMREHRRPACVLYRWTMYDAVTRRAYVSGERPWEGSLIAQREVVPPYPELARKEDTPVIQAMLLQELLVCLDAPELYVYTYHGANTWDERHWREVLLPHAQPLPPEVTLHIEDVLGVARNLPKSPT